MNLPNPELTLADMDVVQRMAIRGDGHTAISAELNRRWAAVGERWRMSPDQVVLRLRRNGLPIHHADAKR
jgi:hypothetical protein